RHSIRQAETASEEVFRRADAKLGGSAGIGKGPVADESQLDGAVRSQPEAADGETAQRTCTGATRRTVDEYTLGRSDHGSYLGVGGGRSKSLFFYRPCSQLLWLNRGFPFF